MTDTSLDDLGPVDYLVVEFPAGASNLELYRARTYGGRASSEYRLREYERASAGASPRLRPSQSAALKQTARSGRATPSSYSAAA